MGCTRGEASVWFEPNKSQAVDADPDSPVMADLNAKVGVHEVL